MRGGSGAGLLLGGGSLSADAEAGSAGFMQGRGGVGLLLHGSSPSGVSPDRRVYADRAKGGHSYSDRRATTGSTAVARRAGM